jgi:DNA-binding CsgD family transcriptional regulator/tetratricopeptide (TPR) repeat protein
VEGSLTGAARRGHHRTVLEALRAADGDPADIAHHAAAIGDVELLVEASTRACERAAEAGAHVEALAHVERILPHADGLPAGDRHQVMRIASYEYSINHRLTEAIEFAERALSTSTDTSERSEALAWLSLVEWWMGRTDESRRHLAESVQVLGGDSPPTELLRRVATDLAHRSSWTDAWSWAMRALEKAERDGDERALGQALNAAEMVGAVVDDPVLARRRGDRAIEIYRREGMQRDLWIAVGNRVASDINTLRIPDASGALDAALALDAELDVASYSSWLTAQRSRYCLYIGAWDDARELAERALAAIPDGLHRATPLMVLAQLTARCVGPPEEPLEEAARLVGTSDDIQRVGNLTIAIAELAWLGSDVDDAWIDHAIGLAADSGHPRYVAELAVWSRRLGRTHREVPDAGPAPLVAELAGDWRTAAAEWAELGCPYERALSLAFSGDPDAMQEAVHAVTELGAHRTADRIRQLLREAGINLTRGPRAATRRNVAGLTNRQIDVAELVAAGLTNVEIAERLFVSPKTVDHHVSAVLMKLGVARRTDVGDALERLAGRR